MTALTADAQLAVRELGLRSYKMDDNVHIYKGSIVSVNPNTGYVTPGVDTAAYYVVGIAFENVDNTLTGHTAGTKRIRVQSGRHYLMTTAGASQSSVGAPVYVTDSGTVGLSSSNSMEVGIITEYISATSVWVFVPYSPATPVALASAATGTFNSLAAGAATFPITGLVGSGAGAGGTTSVTGGVGGATGNGGASSVVGGVGGATSGTGGAANLTGGAAGATTGVGGAATVTGGTGTGANAGGAAQLIGGLAGATGTGGNAVVTAGAGGATSGTGGAAVITGGAGTGTNTIGGVASVTGGAGHGTQAGGAASLVGGVGGATGAGGAVNVTGGASGATSGTGGLVTITGGAGAVNGVGGGVSVIGGLGTLSNAGGAVIITGGASGTTGAQAGGNVTITGGAAGTGSAGAGGNVNLVPGANDGAGAPGEVQINGSTGGFVPVTFQYIATSPATGWIFAALRAYRVKSIVGIPIVAGTGGACTMSLFVCTTTQAPSAGTLLHSGSYNLVGTINVQQTLVLSATTSIPAANSIGYVITGTATSATGMVEITLVPV